MERERAEETLRQRQLSGIVAVTLLAGLVRFVGLDWDQGHAFHPDERAMATAVERISLSPLDLNPRFFAYGSLPVYLVRAIAGLTGASSGGSTVDYRLLLLGGRALSALAGSLTVLLLYFLGRRLYGHATGWLAAALLAACVLHIQQSHFMTADVLLTLLVLAALFAMVRAAEGGSRRDVLVAAVACGMALATKVSALPLVGTLAVALWVRYRRQPAASRRRAVAEALASMAIVTCTFLICEPYALLDFTTFWRQVSEQARMVRHAGELPFTLQYVGTTKVLYELGQIVLWGMAPALGLAALWGSGARVAAALRQRSGCELVLVAWVVPYFLVTGLFEVRFPRYLLPIYPLLVLWAAAWLEARRRAGRWGGALRWGVLAGTVLAALGFLAVYRQPHTAVEASRWVYRHVPAGSTILTPHWDEGFPLPTDEGSSRRYRVVQLPYYEADRPQKLAEMSEELAAADYVAFPTPRIYGAILRAPKRFPQTSQALSLLFDGELGYELRNVFVSRPLILGLEIPDELFDESASVYDHPKVLLFENVERLEPGEIRSRLSERSPVHPRPRRALLRLGLDPSSTAVTGGERSVRSSWLAIVWLGLVVELVGLLAYAVLRRWVRAPGLYALSKILGILLLAYPTWLVSHFTASGFIRSNLFATLVLLAVAAIAVPRRPRFDPPPDWRLTELLFWLTFSVFALLRAFRPAIYWGEKPMDFAILNALYRAVALPPPEPWLSGSNLHYPYFGHYLVAALGKLCGLHPGLAFNLGIALFAALTAAAAFAAGYALTGSRRVGVVASILTALVGNLAGPLALWRRRELDFDYFWATSRVVEETINEFPLWSFLFGDLHSHVLVMPFALSFLALLFGWVRESEGRRRAVLGVLLGLCLGAVSVINAWSAPTWTLVLAFVLGTAVLGEPVSSVAGRLRALVRRALLPAAAVLGVALVAYSPFWLGYRSPGLRWGWERHGSVHLGEYVSIFGLFLFVAVIFLADVWREGKAGAGPRRRWLWPAGAALAAAGLLLTLPVVQGPFRSVRAGIFLLALLALDVGVRRSVEPSTRRIAVLFAFAFLITAGCDVVFVWDRMNTLFKFYLDAWLLLSIASAAAVVASWHRWRILARACVATLVGASLFTGWSGALALSTSPRVASPIPTLDGTAYLSELRPAEGAAIEWLNGRVSGLPVVAEAWGSSYGDYGRVSMHTGLPTVVGWDYHLVQRGQDAEEIERRKTDLRALYTSRDEKEVRRILRRYGIELVYVGWLERETYRTQLDDAEWSHFLVPVYRNEEVTVLASTEWPVRERPPTVETTRRVDVAPILARAPPSAPGELNQPRDVGLAADGRLYVADFDNHRIQVFDSELQPIGGWGREGGEDGEFRQPCSLAISDGNEVFVADTWNHRVQVFDSAGAFLSSWGRALYGPRGIAVSACGVYVADTGNHVLRRFRKDGSSVGVWGGLGSGNDEFTDPTGVAVDDACHVYVADNGNGRVRILDASGSPIGGFPVPGWRTEPYSEPKIDIDAEGLLWVTVPAQGVVRSYDRDGALRAEIRDERMGIPLGIAVSENGDVIVTDLARGLLRLSTSAGSSALLPR